MFEFLMDPQAFGIVVIAGVVVREVTQLLIEWLKLDQRGAKILLSIGLAVIATGLVAWAGWGEWSGEAVGAIWAAAWGAQALKSIGNGGMTMEVFDCGDDSEGK